MNGALRAKLVPGTNCIVDCFRSSATLDRELPAQAGPAHELVRFLSHFHGDHYSGLSADWDDGPVHCSPTTGALLMRVMGVRSHLVITHELNEPINFGTFTVTLLDANHCPGAVLLLVKTAAGSTYLHCGDMRYTPRMKSEPELVAVRGKLDTVFLDTTYAHPNHVFPTQQESTARAVAALREFIARDPARPKVLVLVSAYTIGKERIMFGLCEAMGWRNVYLDERKSRVMDCLGLPADRLAMLGSDRAAPVHVCKMGVVGSIWPFFQPNFGAIRTYVDELREAHGVSFDRTFALIPTGWADASNYNKRNASQLDDTQDIMVHIVPYSEHSNFTELEEFVGFLKPREVVPTVFSDDRSYRAIVHRFRNLIDDRRNKERFFGASASSSPSTVEVVRGEALSAAARAAPAAAKDGPDETEAKKNDSSCQVVALDSPEATESRPPDTTWTCVACTFINEDMLRSACQVCETIRSKPCQKISPRRAPAAGARKRPRKANNGKTATKKTKSILSFFATAAPVQDLSAATLAEDSGGKDEAIVATQELAGREDPATIPDASDEAKESPKADPSSAKGGSEANSSAGVDWESIPLDDAVDAFEPPKGAAVEALQYSLVSVALSKVVSTSKRLEKRKVLVNMFRCAIALSGRNADEVAKVVFLTIGKIANDHESVELSVGGAMISKAIQEATGKTRAQLSSMYKTCGDVGDVAYQCKRSQRVLFGQRVVPLAVADVFDTMHEIAQQRGAGAGERRKQRILKLMRRCRGEEVRFLVRLLAANTRIGANEVSVLDALVEAALREGAAGARPALEKSALQAAVETARTSFNLQPDVRLFVKHLLAGELAACKMTAGVPVRPMLAQVCHGVDEFMEAFAGKGGYACEFKYDGQRVQIHIGQNGAGEVFSRQCQSNTAKFPDVLEIVRQSRRDSARSFIVDAEVVAVDRAKDNQILSFQALSTRPRGGGGQEEAVQGAANSGVQVGVFAFDLLMLNGESLVAKPLRERRALIAQHFAFRAGHFEAVEGEDFAEAAPENREEQARAMLRLMQRALDRKCEGLVAKLLDAEEATYQPGRRSTEWLKLKQDYLSSQADADGGTLVGGGLGDTLDLVPIGAWHGSGRKSSWWSPFLLACYDPEQECYQTVCKVMSGFSDAFYESQNLYYAAKDGDDEDAAPRTLDHKPMDYASALRPSRWFRPCQVWEVRGAELTLSPNHLAAQGLVPGSEQGLSLRFPRFVRVREDKRPEDATTAAQLAELYLAQTRR